MKKAFTVAALATTLPLASADAVMMRYCSAPVAPSIGFVSKPSKPYCAATRSCEDWQVRSYQNDVEDYFRKLKRYANDVESFYSDAGSYVKCMATLD